ncbi:antitoxin [Pseudonocardia bannensis]|uniref:Antitoxin n=1 Tax=Pseudonocardia bannensis TaxID=630973 RepID=A0A848DPP1_9PSEU|nr:antitoxin [Pseudonocardia bannensis]NMH94708.1 antitoxin [Pseudonocardia bannensis]
MGFLDKAKEMLGQHDDKVDQGLDKAGEAAKGRFAGHEDKIDTAVGRAKQATGEGDTTAAPPDAAPPAPAQGGEHAPEVPGGPAPDVPAGPGEPPAEPQR